MGGTHSFVRNDEIDGQGKEVLCFSQKIKLNKRELDRIYHEFCYYEDRSTHLVDLVHLYDRCGLKQLKLVDSLIFEFFDEDKTSQLNFLDFLIALWGFLTADDVHLSYLCFMLFDIGK
jgi:hypothetical protein